jgi:hypothetical protein
MHSSKDMSAHVCCRLLPPASGSVIAVPIPASDAAAAAPLQAAQDQAIAEATAQGVAGRDVTPFLLQRVNELTRGASLTANIALIKNNARVGAEIAVALSRLTAQVGKYISAGCRLGHIVFANLKSFPFPFWSAQAVRGGVSPAPAAAARALLPSPSSAEAAAATVVVVGGNALDLLARPSPGTPLRQFTSNPGTVARQWGGVSA